MSYGQNMTGTCPGPYVSRQAFPGDEVCVVREESAKTQRESADFHRNMKYYLFFNGQEDIHSIPNGTK